MATRRWSVGEPVRLKSFKTIYEIAEGPNQRGEYRLVGRSISVWAQGEDLKEAAPAPQRKRTLAVDREVRTHVKIDLHGLTVDQALEELTSTLDRALLEQTSQIEIIHGRGTGRLRQAVLKYLSSSSHVSRVQQVNDATVLVYL